jgi:hypothetical protein
MLNRYRHAMSKCNLDVSTRILPCRKISIIRKIEIPMNDEYIHAFIQGCFSFASITDHISKIKLPILMEGELDELYKISDIYSHPRPDIYVDVLKVNRIDGHLSPSRAHEMDILKYQTHPKDIEPMVTIDGNLIKAWPYPYIVKHDTTISSNIPCIIVYRIIIPINLHNIGLFDNITPILSLTNNSKIYTAHKNGSNMKIMFDPHKSISINSMHIPIDSTFSKIILYCNGSALYNIDKIVLDNLCNTYKTDEYVEYLNMDLLFSRIGKQLHNITHMVLTEYNNDKEFQLNVIESTNDDASMNNDITNIFTKYVHDHNMMIYMSGLFIDKSVSHIRIILTDDSSGIYNAEILNYDKCILDAITTSTYGDWKWLALNPKDSWIRSKVPTEYIKSYGFQIKFTIETDVPDKDIYIRHHNISMSIDGITATKFVT